MAARVESTARQAAVRVAIVIRAGWRHARFAVAGITISILFLNGTVSAQTASTSVSASFDIKAVRVTKPPLIDGEVGDTEWEGATTVTSFIQYEPRRGDGSDARTDALVLYDAGHLYVAFRAWDTDTVTAQLTQRDADLLRDDAVVVVVDTTNDQRSGYYFITNVLGTQADGRIADDGRSSESTWDAPWQSAARRTDLGRPMAVRGKANRLWVVGGIQHPFVVPQVHRRRPSNLGHQLRPQSSPNPGAELLERSARQPVASLAGRSPDVAQRAATPRSDPGRAAWPDATTGSCDTALGGGHRRALRPHPNHVSVWHTVA